MVRTALSAGSLALLAVLAACSAGTPGPAAAPAPAEPDAPPAAAEPAPDAAPADSTVMDGIYTAAQASRGEEVYRAQCVECHETQEYTEQQFRSRWDGRWAIQLWYYIHDRMPYGNPYSLTREQVTDVFAYILQLNGAPTGPDELGTDDPSLMPYMINWGSAPGF